MKAEQRKQLEKNELVSQLDRLWKGASEAGSGSTLWVVVGAAVLVGALVFAWRYYADSSTKNRSNLWRQIEQANTIAELEGIIEANRGTSIARVAKAQIARMALSDGLAKLCSDTQREKAIADVEKARTLYSEVAKESKADPALEREALLAYAKAEESLVGIPKADNVSESRGSLDRALEIYQEVTAKHGESPQGKDAAARAKEIKDNKAGIQRFYEELAKRYHRQADLPKIDATTPKPTTPSVLDGPTKPVDPLPPKIDPLPIPPKPMEPPAKPPLPAPPKPDPAKPDPAKPDPAKPATPDGAKPDPTKPAAPSKPEPAKSDPAKPATPAKPEPPK